MDERRHAGRLGPGDHAVGRTAEHPLVEVAVARGADHEDATLGRGGLDQPVGDRRRFHLLDVRVPDGGDGVGGVLGAPTP